MYAIGLIMTFKCMHMMYSDQFHLFLFASHSHWLASSSQFIYIPFLLSSFLLSPPPPSSSISVFLNDSMSCIRIAYSIVGVLLFMDTQAPCCVSTAELTLPHSTTYSYI